MTRHLTPADHRRIASTGFTPLSTDDALALFDSALTCPDPVVIAVGRGGGNTGHAAAPPTTPSAQTPDGAVSLRQRLAGLSAGERRRMLLGVVRMHAAAVLGHASASAVDPERGFLDLGFDSLAALELRNRINAATGLRLQTTLAFDHPTPEALADRLAAEFAGIPDARRDAIMTADAADLVRFALTTAIEPKSGS
jgi:polyketide synthase 12